MLKKMPIKWRLTVLSVLLLTLCCVGLTTILNLSAYRMATAIEATLVMPAQTIKADEVGEVLEAEIPAAGIMSAPLTPVEGSQAAKSRFLEQSVLYMILVVLLGGVLTYYISGKALKPLQELSGQMKKRTVHNLSEALPVPPSHDEIAQMTCAFNEMSAKLEEAFAMQKRFSQSAAHELRTPLTVLKTKVDVFRKKQEHTPEDYDKLLSVITTHTNRLADLVQDLLNLTNMDALDCDEPIELRAMLTAVVEELAGLAKAKSLTITMVGETHLVRGNSSLLHRAFYNVLENAIKYNVDGGQVRLCLATAGGRHVVTIADTGVSIPAEAQGVIFEPFYRVDKSRARQMGGAGLGLATVKAIVAQHHGQITVADNPEGGTIFTIIL